MQSGEHKHVACDFLALVIDVNPLVWALRSHLQEDIAGSSPPSKRRSSSGTRAGKTSQTLSFSGMLEHILVFVNTFLIANRRNTVAVIGAWAGPPYVLYSSPCT